MDDIIREIKSKEVDEKLHQINNIHPSLKFTIEKEVNKAIPFLDMKLLHPENGSLSSTWYNKPTDTGLIMNYHSLAPKRYKRSVVSGFVYRIYRACSSWEHFNDSLNKAKRVLEQNQYPPSFYDQIISNTITKLVNNGSKKSERGEDTQSNQIKPKKYPLIVQYRGKCSEDYARALHRCSAPCAVIFTIRKLKTTLPSLKPCIEKMIRSGVVYQIKCPRCNSCYVGQTSRHLQSRFANM